MFHEYLMCSSVVPAVPWMTSVELPADRRGKVFAEPAFARAGVADKQQRPVGGERDDRPFDDRGVAEELAGDFDFLLLAVDRRVQRFAADDVGQNRTRRELPRREGGLVRFVLTKGIKLVRESYLGRAAAALRSLPPLIAVTPLPISSP